MATTTVKKTPVLPNAPVTKTNPPVLPGSATTSSPTPLANPISTPKPINNAQSVTIGDKTFGLDYANDPANAEELRQAIINGRNKVSITDGSGATFDNATGNQLTSAPTVPKFDSQSYINGITSASNASADSANASRIAMINARLAEQLGAQDGLIRDAEGNLVKKTDTIHANTYDAQETQKANGVQTGIQYSQQQQALQNGISRAGTKMIVDAGKERDTAIMNIKDRIASLKSGASYEMQASVEQANAEKSKALADATAQANQRDWSLQDLTASQNYNDKTIANANAYDTAKTDKLFTHDEQMKALDFDNQVKLGAIDQANKEILMKLDTTEKLKVMAVQDKYDKEGKKIDLASAIQLAGVNAGFDMQKISYQESQANARNTANINASANETAMKIKADTASAIAKAGAEKNQFLNSFLASDPTFNPYNLKDAKSQKQLTYLAELNGVTPEVLRTLIGGNPDQVDSAVSSIAKTQGTSKSNVISKIGASIKSMFTPTAPTAKQTSNLNAVKSFLNAKPTINTPVIRTDAQKKADAKAKDDAIKKKLGLK